MSLLKVKILNRGRNQIKSGIQGKLIGNHKFQTSSFMSIIENCITNSQRKSKSPIIVDMAIMRKVGRMCLSFLMYVSNVVSMLFVVVSH